MAEITFDNEVRWDFERDCLVLWATQGEERLRCLVSRRVLTDFFPDEPQANSAELQTAGEAHRDEFEPILRQMIEEGGLTRAADYDGREVVMTPQDFENRRR